MVMSDEPATIGYYLSDRAYSQLILFARIQRYVKWDSNRVKGLSDFLNELASYPLHDTRPDSIKRRHREEIQHNRAPSWMLGQRRLRPLKLTDETIAEYVQSALAHGIIREEPYAIGGPRRNTPYPTVAFVLEGIGLKWLTPTEFPLGRL